MFFQLLFLLLMTAFAMLAANPPQMMMIPIAIMAIDAPLMKKPPYFDEAKNRQARFSILRAKARSLLQ